MINICGLHPYSGLSWLPGLSLVENIYSVSSQLIISGWYSCTAFTWLSLIQLIFVSGRPIDAKINLADSCCSISNRAVTSYHLHSASYLTAFHHR